MNVSHSFSVWLTRKSKILSFWFLTVLFCTCKWGLLVHPRILLLQMLPCLMRSLWICSNIINIGSTVSLVGILWEEEEKKDHYILIMLRSKSAYLLQLPLQSAYCCMQYTYNWDILLFHNVVRWNLTVLLILMLRRGLWGRIVRKEGWLVNCKMRPGVLGIWHTMYMDILNIFLEY